MGYSLTVYEAPPLTPKFDGLIPEVPSLLGHMYYVLSKDGTEVASYGFDPSGNVLSSVGSVSHTDYATYKVVGLFSDTIPITESQFNTLNQFGLNPSSFGFSPNYTVIGNSCVNFVWSALAQIGVQVPADPYWVPIGNLVAVNTALGKFASQQASLTNTAADISIYFSPTQSITVAGGQTVSLDANNGYLITGSSGASYHIDPYGGNGDLQLSGQNINALFAGSQVNSILLGNTVNIALQGGSSLTLNQTTGISSYLSQGNISTVLGSGQVDLQSKSIGVGTQESGLGYLFQQYTLQNNGQLTRNGTEYYVGDSSQTGTVGQLINQSTVLKNSIDAVDPIQAPMGAVDNHLLPFLSVDPLTSAVNTGSQAADTSSTVANGLVLSGSDYGASLGWSAGIPTSSQTSANNIANSNGVFSTSPSGVVTGGFRPGNSAVQAPSQNETILITDETQAQYIPLRDATSPATQAAITNELAANVLASYATTAPTLTNIDPLLIDLTGEGVRVSNWIDNLVLFDTNVVPALTSAGIQAYNPNGSLKYTGPDETQVGNNAQGVPVFKPTEHQTSWMQSGTGMLVYDPSGAPVTDITQTISQFLNVGYGVGQFATSSLTSADGLQTLANLAQPGATVFDAATSLLDAKNNNESYWNEIMVATGQPVLNADGTTSIPTSQLETLAQAGIAAISLVGTGNQGESVNGSSVTNLSTYTSTSGTVSQIAAVDFQTNTTGNVTVPGPGDSGLVINSIPEGGVSPTNSYLDQSTTARSFKVQGGTLTDLTNGVVVTTGLVGFFASGQNDTVTVGAGDTTSYWLGAGAGAVTLDASQAAGNIMFLVNAETTIKGGSGFNIAQVTDSGSISINLAADHLEEVIGGAGDGTFNASGTNYNVFIQGGSGNNVIIGGGAHDALSGGTGDDLIEAGNGGSVIHAGSGNDVIYGGSGTTGSTPNSDIIYGGPGRDTVILGTDNSDVFAGTGSMVVVGQSGAFSVVSFHGSYADYTVTRNPDGSETVTDKNPEQDGPVTVKGVTDFDFADINQLATNLAAGLPVNDIISITGAGPYVIQSSVLLANDQDYAGNPLAINNLVDVNGNLIARGKSGTVTGGVAALSTDGSFITFTPVTGFSGIPSFEYSLQGGETVNQVSPTGVIGAPVPLAATVTLLSPTMPTDPGIADEYYLAAADVLPAWSAGDTGTGVSVAVFDPSGNADSSNPDLTINGIAEYQNAGVPGISETGTHATLVSGVIAAARDGEGQVGVAYNAQLVSEATASGTSTGVQLAASLEPWKNFDVVNNSWGPTGGAFSDQFGLVGGSQVQQAFWDAVTQGRGGLGTIILFASGNTATNDTNEHNLTNSPDEIVVGGVDPKAGSLGTLETPSARFATPGASILVSAPDQFIATTGALETNEYGEQFGGTSVTEAGTSLATPIVSGVVALMLQANPNLGYQDVQQILAYTAKEVTDPNTTWSTNGATDWNGGGLHTSYLYGFGEVDAAAAVRLAKTWSNVSQNANYAGGALATSDPLSWGPSYTANLPAGSGAATVEHFQIGVDLWDANLSDLTITLTAPNGLVSTLISTPQNITYTGVATDQNNVTHQDFNYTFDTVQDLGSSLFGSWKVSITGNKGAAEPGTVRSVSFLPEIDNPVTAHIYTDEFGSVAANTTSHSTTLTDTATGVTLNASAVSTGMTLDLRPGSTDTVIAGQSLSIAANTTVRAADGGAGNDVIQANNAGDTITAGGGVDVITGGQGSDTFIVSSGTQTITGGGGSDTLVVSSQSTSGSSPWTVVQNPSGSVTFSGLNVGLAETATVTGVQKVSVGGILYDLLTTPASGGQTTVKAPTDGAAENLVADGTGNDALTFSSSGISDWHAGGGNDTATLARGTTNIYLEGNASQYTVSGFADSRLTVVDSVAGRNGTKVITVGGGSGNLIFSDGTSISLAPADPLFDASYYLAQNPDVAASGVDAYQQYLTAGWQQGRNPNAYFDTNYYLAQNPDVKAAGVNPLLHFELYGWKEGRQPSLLFSDSTYLTNNPDVKAAGVNPLQHYLQYGQYEGRQASLTGFDGNLAAADPLVNESYFDHQLGATLLPTGAAGQAQAAELYHSSGWKAGLNPDADFDTNYYLTQNPDVKAAKVDPLLHFEQYGWKEGRQPSLVFDDGKYLSAYTDVKAAGVDPLVHYMTYGQSEGRMAFLTGGTAAADPLIDPTFYDKQLGATIVPTSSAGAQQAAWSFNTSGWQKGLSPDAYFDVNYYLSHNPDVAAAHVNPLIHYETYGWKEGRDPSAIFSTNKYEAAYADVKAAGVDPLLHYVQYGQAEGRTAFHV